MRPKHILLISWGAFFLLSSLFFFGCKKDKDPTPEEQAIEKIINETPVDPYTIAKKLLDQAGWPEEHKLNFDLGSIQLLNYKREVVTGDIVHYSFEVQVGTNQYDKIGIHRVVKETTPGQPLKTEKNFFFQHGDLKNFTGMMLPATYSPSMPNDFGLGIYLAQNGVDVWGIDQAWCAVPADATDFTFFKDFGMEKAVQDMRNAMAVARITRYLTGNALDKMNLAGYSSGVSTVYVAADLETQLEASTKHVKGLISIDKIIKTDQAIINMLWDSELATSQEAYDLGNYQAYLGFTWLSSLAQNDPDGPSPVFEGFSNVQVILYYGCFNTSGVLPYHFWAADWVNDFPAVPKYTTLEQILDFGASAIEYQPHRFWIDYKKLLGNTHDSPFDDHFAQIKVPIFNIYAAGGFGEPSKYGSTQTGSTDITHLGVSLETAENILYDFGHVDLFTGYNAQTMMWEGLLNWINAH